MSCNCLNVKGDGKPIPFICENNDRDVEFVPLVDFLPRVSLIAEGVPEDVAIEYLRQASQDIARDSRLLKRTVTFDVQRGVKDYYLESGLEQINIINSVGIRCGKRWCNCKLDHDGRGFYAHLKEYRSDEFYFEPPDKIVLTKTPTNDDKQVKVEYYAMPSQSTCKVDKLLFDRYQDVMVNGALSHLLFMRKYDFADPQLAYIYEKRFKQGIAQVKIDVARDFETGTQSLLNRRFV